MLYFIVCGYVAFLLHRIPALAAASGLGWETEGFEEWRGCRGGVRMTVELNIRVFIRNHNFLHKCG